MDAEDFMELPGPSSLGHGSENDTPSAFGHDSKNSGSLPPNLQLMDEVNGENPTILNGLHVTMETSVLSETEKEADMNPEVQPVCVEMTKSVKIQEEKSSISSTHTLVAHSEFVSNLEKDDPLLSKDKKDASYVSGVKRPRMIVDEQQPSVHIIFNSLPRKSKQKLEELLKQWSHWHSQSFLPSDDSSVITESGEETYFPALHVGVDNPSSVTYWVDNQTRTRPNKEFTPLDDTSVPLYDRGYSLALTSAGGSGGTDGGGEELDSSRCFNCGSYNHALKSCPKPRNNAAVNNARKLHKSRRTQQANSHNTTRYYQSPKVGKYDGLIPGVLHAETREALGIGKLDPPPWLNRMRELGYPPGYLVVEVNEEDQPSGLTIFGEEDTKEEGEEGEILDVGLPKPSKMSVKFPGINAPIPENADERLWASPSPFNSHQHRDDPKWRYNHHPTEHLTRWRHSEHRWSSKGLDDEGPPGCEPGTSPSLSYHLRRYSDTNNANNYYSRSPQDSPATPWNSLYNRSSSFRHR
ncbi:uncharacterized protein LOC127242217 [Andrographis paniculata]|uniref:uncharacterized protein LOC127242217 n=1 Tax=Andrographis paniculata TaxID=175694 RepID=UPI0021E70508|nr:uncharacterized protein LOC127242217 [Andrographis paniculata]